jgi:hypothetical protein
MGEELDRKKERKREDGEGSLQRRDASCGNGGADLCFFPSFLKRENKRSFLQEHSCSRIDADMGIWRAEGGVTEMPRKKRKESEKESEREKQRW